MQGELEALRPEVDRLTGEAQKARTEARSEREAKEAMQQELVELRPLKERIETQDQQIRQLQKTVKDLEELDEDTKRLIAEKLEEKDTEIARVKAQNEALRGTLTGQISGKDAKIRELQAEILTIWGTVGNLNEEIRRLQQA